MCTCTYYYLKLLVKINIRLRFTVYVCLLLYGKPLRSSTRQIRTLLLQSNTLVVAFVGAVVPAVLL